MPSKEDLRAKWNSAGEDVVVLHTFPRPRLCPNLSPFAMKLETYLRLANIEYVMDHEQPSSVKGTTPWMTFNGEDMADSQLCIEFLGEKLGKDLSKDLSSEQRALARALRIMLEDNHYWCNVTWQMKISKGRFLKENMPKLPVPGFLVGLIVSAFASKAAKQAVAQGIGRHGKEEVEKIGLDNLWAVSASLGSHPYMFGEEPSELDAVVFAFVAITICSVNDDDSPFKKAILEEGGDLANLKQHFDRVKDKFFPDWEQLLWKPS